MYLSSKMTVIDKILRKQKIMVNTKGETILTLRVRSLMTYTHILIHIVDLYT